MPLPQPVDVSPRAGRFRRKAPEIPQTDAILEGLIGEPNAQNMRIPCEAAALGGYMGFDLPPAFRLRSAIAWLIVSSALVRSPWKRARVAAVCFASLKNWPA